MAQREHARAEAPGGHSEGSEGGAIKKNTAEAALRQLQGSRCVFRTSYSLTCSVQLASVTEPANEVENNSRYSSETPKGQLMNWGATCLANDAAEMVERSSVHEVLTAVRIYFHLSASELLTRRMTPWFFPL